MRCAAQRRVLASDEKHRGVHSPLCSLDARVVAGSGCAPEQGFAGVGVYKVLFFLPVLTSWVAGSLIWRWILNHKYGLVNVLLGHIGIAGPAWLDDKYWAMPGIVLASVWKDAGFFALIFLGALKGINYETTKPLRSMAQAPGRSSGTLLCRSYRPPHSS